VIEILITNLKGHFLLKHPVDGGNHRKCFLFSFICGQSLAALLMCYTLASSDVTSCFQFVVAQLPRPAYSGQSVNQTYLGAYKPIRGSYWR